MPLILHISLKNILILLLKNKKEPRKKYFNLFELVRISKVIQMTRSFIKGDNTSDEKILSVKYTERKNNNKSKRSNSYSYTHMQTHFL